MFKIRFGAEQAKRRAREGTFEILTALGETLPPIVLRFVTKSLHRASNRVPLPANLVFSSVRGLPIPTYMAGARVEAMYPMSMLQVANGMNVTAVTHDDQVDFGFLVDPKLIPDPWVFADGVPGALEELEVATAGTLAQRAMAEEPPKELNTHSDPELTRSAEPGELPEEAQSGPEIEAEPDPLDLSLIMAGLDRNRTTRDEVI